MNFITSPGVVRPIKLRWMDDLGGDIKEMKSA
jgi:hypothetical protein